MAEVAAPVGGESSQNVVVVPQLTDEEKLAAWAEFEKIIY